MTRDTSPIDDTRLAELCETAVREEAEAVARFAETGGSAMAKAVRLIHTSTGPLVVAGIGKSGHVAGKIASTFRSLGQAAIFLHAAEASHGDLGLVAPDSVILILSYSGETTELSDLIHYARTHGNAIIAMTATEDSTLARAAEITIAFGEVSEVCPKRSRPNHLHHAVPRDWGRACCRGYTSPRHSCRGFPALSPGRQAGPDADDRARPHAYRRRASFRPARRADVRNGCSDGREGTWRGSRARWRRCHGHHHGRRYAA